MPLRSASNGRHGSGETSWSALKPNRTLPHSVSTPPTMAASTRPRRSIRSAVANTFALDEQAVETVTHGPSRPSAAWTKSASECGVWTSGLRLSAGNAPSASSWRYASSVAPMLEVDVPRTTATRAAPWRSRAAWTASMKASPFRPSQASRLLRHSQAASGLGQRRGLDAGDAADPGRQRRRPEVVRREGAAAVAQRGVKRGLADAGGGGHGVGADAQRGDRGGHGAGLESAGDYRGAARPAKPAGPALEGQPFSAPPRFAVDHPGDDDAAEDDDHRGDGDQRRPRAQAVQQRAEDERAEPLADEEAAREERHRRAARRRRELGRLGLHRVVQHVEADAGDEHRQRRQPPARNEGERGVADGGRRRADQAHAAHAEERAGTTRTPNA